MFLFSVLLFLFLFSSPITRLVNDDDVGKIVID